MPVKGRQIRAAVPSPAAIEVRTRSGSALPSRGASDRRSTTKPTRRPRMPSWIFVSAATTANAAASSRRSRRRARRPSSMKTEPTTSAWPQIALLNQVTGLNMITAAAIRARRRDAPSSCAMLKTRQARARSVTMGISLTSSPTPPNGLPIRPRSHRKRR